MWLEDHTAYGTLDAAQSFATYHLSFPKLFARYSSPSPLLVETVSRRAMLRDCGGTLILLLYHSWILSCECQRKTDAYSVFSFVPGSKTAVESLWFLSASQDESTLEPLYSATWWLSDILQGSYFLGIFLNPGVHILLPIERSRCLLVHSFTLSLRSFTTEKGVV